MPLAVPIGEEMAEKWNRTSGAMTHNASSAWPPIGCNGGWNCSDDYSYYYYYNSSSSSTTPPANLTEWINSTRPEDNLIFTSLTSAVLGVLILATIVGK